MAESNQSSKKVRLKIEKGIGLERPMSRSNHCSTGIQLAIKEENLINFQYKLD